jgi:hypothetical protein
METGPKIKINQLLVEKSTDSAKKKKNGSAPQDQSNTS